MIPATRPVAARPVAVRPATGPARLATGVRLLVLIVFVGALFFPYLAGMAAPMPYVMFIALWSYSLLEGTRRFGLSLRLAALVILPAVVLILAYWFFALPDAVTKQFGDLPGVIRAYLLVPPMALVAGALLLRDPLLHTLLRVFRAFAALTAALAIVEYVRGSFLFPGNVSALGMLKFTTSDPSGGSGIRTLVATEHPLVLAALLASAIPFVLAGPFAFRRLAEALLLIAGIYTTSSEGPLGLGILALVIGLFLPRSLRRSWKAGAAAFTVFAVAVVGFLLLAIAVWTPVVDERDGDPSTQYRFALYSLIPRIVTTHPFGYGIGDVPAGSLLLAHNGPSLDVARTVDSELMLLVIQFGILGFLVFFAILWLAIRGVLVGGPGRTLGAALLVTTVAGFFLALHVWSALGPYWEVLIGAALAALTATRKGDEQKSASRGELIERTTQSSVPNAAHPVSFDALSHTRGGDTAERGPTVEAR